MLYLPTNFTKVCFNFSWLGWSTITLRKLYSWCKYQEVKGSKDQLLVLPELQSSSSTSILTFSSWRFFCEDSVVCSLLHHIVDLIIPNHMVMHYWHFWKWVIKICICRSGIWRRCIYQTSMISTRELLIKCCRYVINIPLSSSA